MIRTDRFAQITLRIARATKFCRVSGTKHTAYRDTMWCDRGFKPDEPLRHFLRGSSSQRVPRAIACRYGCRNGGEGSGGCVGGDLLFMGKGGRWGTHTFAAWNLSSTELESGNAIGAFLQTRAPVLDKISGPMGARFLSSTGLGSGNLIEWAQFPPAPALDKKSVSHTHTHTGTHTGTYMQMLHLPL